MKTIVLLPILFLLSLSTLAVECTGERREVVGTQVEVIRESLIDQNVPHNTKLTLDIEEAYFSVTVEGDDVLAMITLGPDYTNGNLFKGSFDSNGSLRLSSVSPTKTYILECNK